MHGNLFVVSRVGQVRNVQTLITRCALANNHLVVLYTAGNVGLMRNIRAVVQPGLFDGVEYVRQPDRPTRETRRTNRTVYRQFENVLEAAVDAGVTRLFLCNIDSYYGLFERIIKARKLPLSVNLLEEGLTTYAVAGGRRYHKDTKVASSDVSYRARLALESWRRALRSTVVLAATALSWLFRVDLFTLRNAIRAGLVKPEHRYGTVTHVDTAWVYFPERIKSSEALTIDRVESLPFDASAPQDAGVAGALDDDATLFVSQKYLSVDDYLSIIFDILTEMGVGRVYFKYHPREDRTSFARAWNRIHSSHPGLEIVAPDAIQVIPVEELVCTGKVKRVIGLTSTSLMYTAAFLPAVEVVSIGMRFRELAESPQYGIAKRPLSEFVRDLEVFNDVSGVEQYSL